MLKCSHKHWRNGFLIYSYQNNLNIAIGKETPQEMVKNVKSPKQIGENMMNEFIAKFTFQENNSSENTYYDSLKKRKFYHLSQPVTRKCGQLQKMKINLSVKFLYASITKRSICKTMNWPITNKSYSICSEDGKVKANTKPLFRNKLQSLCPIAPTNLAPKCVSASVVVAMRLVQIIPIKSTDLPSYSTWAKNLFAYIENLPEIIYLLSLIIIIVKVISSLACRNKDFKVLQKETSAA